MSCSIMDLEQFAVEQGSQLLLDFLKLTMRVDQVCTRIQQKTELDRMQRGTPLFAARGLMCHTFVTLASDLKDELDSYQEEFDFLMQSISVSFLFRTHLQLQDRKVDSAEVNLCMKNFS